MEGLPSQGTCLAEAGLVLALSGLGALLGFGFSRLKSGWWTLGYFIPLTLIAALVLTGNIVSLQFSAPISWLYQGRVPYAVIGLITAMILTTPLSRLPRKSTRMAVGLLMVLMVLMVAVWPFLEPALIMRAQASLTTRMDADQVCLQSTAYNCGPAASVTVLRRLGLPAEEGLIAVAGHTCSAIGTPPDLLARTLEKHYRKQGLRCQYRVFKDLQDLKAAGLTLAVMHLTYLVDHYVAVLEVTDKAVVVGDPLFGKKLLSHEDFLTRWRRLGITLQIDPKASSNLLPP